LIWCQQRVHTIVDESMLKDRKAEVLMHFIKCPAASWVFLKISVLLPLVSMSMSCAQNLFKSRDSNSASPLWMVTKSLLGKPHYQKDKLWSAYSWTGRKRRIAGRSVGLLCLRTRGRAISSGRDSHRHTDCESLSVTVTYTRYPVATAVEFSPAPHCISWGHWCDRVNILVTDSCLI